MTKTLTEQWRDGTLPEGWYYVVREWDDEIRMLYFEGDYFLDTDVPLDNDNIKEVLAPVPSYDEWQSYDKCADMLIDVNKKWHKTIVENKKLKKQLAIATKALKKMAKDNFQCAEQAFEEIELREVK